MRVYVYIYIPKYVSNIYIYMWIYLGGNFNQRWLRVCIYARICAYFFICYACLSMLQLYAYVYVILFIIVVFHDKYHMSNPKKMVTTGTVKFETLIPKGISRNQTGKTLWNKDFIFSHRNPMENL